MAAFAFLKTILDVVDGLKKEFQDSK